MENQTISFSRKQTCEIFLGSDILPQVVGRVSRMGLAKKCVVLTNDIVGKWYLEPLLAELRGRGFSSFSLTVPDGEEAKTLETAASIYPQLLEAGIDRHCPLFALGGGVITDLGGFIAATWMRGIPFIPIPTTLLAMVDASVGGKTAVNLPMGKNLVGAFHQPVAVGIDVTLLRTLPLTQLSYGLVEAIKHGAIADSAYFKFIQKSRSEIKSKEPGLIHRLVRRSINIKKVFVEEDELDTGRRAFLNFGHTFGHAFEVLGAYRRLHHGEAVGLGMIQALLAARRLGILREDYSESLAELLVDFNLPIRVPLEWTADDIANVMLRDKKRKNEKINLILPTALGAVSSVPISASELPGLLTDILQSQKRS
ncbi:MAG: 3-dehydroquinate synthase [Candidatus Ozemobacteraceae bacterium]